MRVCGPLLDRALIADTYACRPGKGRTAAVDRAVEFTRRFDWVLKLDIHRYFDSVDQARLAAALERRFKDPSLLRLFRMILGSYQTEPGRGLPIGNLTSQYFANYYLDPLDRWLKEGLRRNGYLRYMDDFLVFADSADELSGLADLIDQFVGRELGLRVKQNRSLHATHTGVNFLGYRLQVQDRKAPGSEAARTWIFLARRSKLRFRRRLGQLFEEWTEGRLSDLAFQRRSLALCEFTQRARALNFRRRVLGELEIGADGLASRGPGRQLEQRSGELPLREPERESPGQPEQQPGLSPGFGPSSTGGSENRAGGTGGDFSGRAQARPATSPRPAQW